MGQQYITKSPTVGMMVKMSDEELEAWTAQRIRDVQNHFRKLTAGAQRDYFDAMAAQIVMACADADATDWPADLHLADVIEKHLVRTLRAVTISPAGTSRKARGF